MLSGIERKYGKGIKWRTRSNPIIVTARFGSGFFQNFGFDPSQFLGGVGSFFVGGLTLASFYASNPKHFKIPGNQNKPETATNNLSSSQLAAVLSAVDNAEKDAGLDASFKEMASKNVKLTVTVQNQAPSWFDDPSSQVVDVAGQGVPAGAAAYSFSDGSSISSASYSLGALEVGTWSFAGAAGRYKDVTSYTSHAVDSSAILSELASAVIMQLSASRPGVEDLFAGPESSRPSIQADLASHLWQGPVHQLIGAVDVAFV